MVWSRASCLLTLCIRSALKWCILFARNRTTWNLLQIKLRMMNPKCFRENISYISYNAVQLLVRRYILVFAHLSFTNVSACSILLLYYLDVEFQYVKIVCETHGNSIVLDPIVIRMSPLTITKALCGCVLGIYRSSYFTVKKSEHSSCMDEICMRVNTISIYS